MYCVHFLTTVNKTQLLIQRCWPLIQIRRTWAGLSNMSRQEFQLVICWIKLTSASGKLCAAALFKKVVFTHLCSINWTKVTMSEFKQRPYWTFGQLSRGIRPKGKSYSGLFWVFSNGSPSRQLFSNMKTIKVDWLTSVSSLTWSSMQLSLLCAQRAEQNNLSFSPHKVIYSAPKVSIASYSHVYLVQLSGDLLLVSLLTTASLPEAY